MIVFPAIDILKKRCVRLRQGSIENRITYALSPEQMAKYWEAKGAKYLHVIDLDGAIDGKIVNHDDIYRLCQAVSIPVQVGGGIRRLEDIEEKLQTGAQRVIIGTAAVKNPTFLQQALRQYGPEKIVVAIDVRNGKAAIEGWEESSEVDPIRLAVKMKVLGVQTLMVTDIERDGMLTGPNTSLGRQLKEATDLEIIVSGGVTDIRDLDELQAAGVGGAICGCALYEQKIDLQEINQHF